MQKRKFHFIMIVALTFFIFNNISLLACSNTKLEKTFKQSPAETVTLNKIQYLFYNYQVTWEEARIICSGYESQLATIDTIEKALYITKQTSESSLADQEFWIGSKMQSQGFWTWISSNKKLKPNVFFQEIITSPRYINRSLDSDFHCLTIFRKNHSIPLFSPLCCEEHRPFICQQDELSLGTHIDDLFTVKIENKDFTLFSAKLTWLESVVQCRHRGLQIAEVSTTAQAQLLAIKMIKARPRSIENAWIGGYVKDRLWKWLPTGSNITRNQMWYDENMISGECLLLDRHVCEFPMYVSTKCNRKRNFLCQTPVQKLVQPEPVAVFVDTCQYWIGFNPRKWLDASQSCRKLNATLVVLDSPTTLNHITNIMIDNRGKLQHIWIDGRRQHEAMNDKVNDSILWKWDSSAERIPILNESFIPWYDDPRLYENNTDCLNMDRENFDVPIVYGLDCNTEQTYICQKSTVSCNQIKNINILNSTYESTTDLNRKLLLNSKDSNIKPEHVKSKVDTLLNNKLSYKTIGDLSTISNFNTVTEHNIQHKLDTERSTLADNYTDNYFSISPRLLLDDFVSRKKLNQANNNQVTTNIPILGFKDIIELMARNVGDSTNLSNILLSNTDKNKSKQVSLGYFDKKSNNKIDEQLQTLLHDNVSKIVQSSINKNINKSNSVRNSTFTILTTKILSNEKFLNNISHIDKIDKNLHILRASESPISSFKNDASVKSVPGQYTNVGPTVTHVTDANNMYGLGEIMKNIFNPRLKVDNFHTNRKEKDMLLNASISTTEKNSRLYNVITNTKKKNLSHRRMHSSKNTIQSIRKHGNKNRNKINVTDIMDAIKHDFDKFNSKPLSLAIMNDMPFKIKKDQVKPWNVLLQHVFQSLNNTKINVNNQTASLHIKNYS